METQSAPANVTDSMIESMRQTRPWVMLISVLIFISVGFMVLAVLGMVIGGRYSPLPGGGVMLMTMAAIYLLMALLYFFPGLFLVRYAGAIGRLTNSRTAGDLEVALAHQKSFWKFVGIVALISIVFAIVAVLGGVASTLMMSQH